MAKISVNINKAALTASMTEGGNRSSVSSLIRQEWQRKIIEAQNQMVQAYEDDPVTVDIFVVDSSSTAGYYIKGIVVPANSSLKVITNGEKLILAEQCGLKILSDTDNSIDAVISYAEIV